jgi:TM2 domain-containing membrane protein YozV
MTTQGNPEKPHAEAHEEPALGTVSHSRGGLVRPDSVDRVDADFATEVLSELYSYRHKRPLVAFLLWGVLGWFGAHRFYLERPVTGLLMLGSLGGGLIWWLIDPFLIPGMVRSFNAEQSVRRRTGLPPVELAFMPPLNKQVLGRPPQWTEHWHAGSPWRRRLRFAGDVAVLLLAGIGLGVVARTFGAFEAVVPVAVLIGLTAAGGAGGWLHGVPLVGSLVTWSHRLRLFYYYNKPGSPAALLLRPLTGILLAPFRQRARAEVRLYLELGAVFTLLFLLEDIVSAVLEQGLAALTPLNLLQIWLTEVIVNFVVIYSFSTQIGAVLTLYLLVRPTHTVPRLLSLLVAVAVVFGATL